MPLPSVTCTVHPANRAHRAGHIEFHTRAHVQNPSVPNSLPSLTFVRPQDQQHHRVRFRTGSLTLATVLAVVSSVARHGLPVLYRADPARSQLQLLPLPGICIATVAVAVAIHASHPNSRVPRDSYCTQSHSSSLRETRPHVRTWRLTSPLCTATSHTRSLSHTVGHSHTVPHSRRPHHSHPREHSPAVSHTHVGVHTHVPLLARTWFLPTADMD